MTAAIAASVDAVARRWHLRLSEWPSLGAHVLADVLAELERLGSPPALALKARLVAMGAIG